MQLFIQLQAFSNAIAYLGFAGRGYLAPHPGEEFITFFNFQFLFFPSPLAYFAVRVPQKLCLLRRSSLATKAESGGASSSATKAEKLCAA